MKNPILKHLAWVCRGCPMHFGIAAAAAAVAVAGVAGSMMASGAQQDAAGNALNAANATAAQQRKDAGMARDAANSYQQPYYNTGTAAQNKLAYGLGVSNTFDTPNDTSLNAFRAQTQQQLTQHLANKPTKKQDLVKWNSTKKALQDRLKGDTNNPGYQKWVQQQPKTTQTQLPIDSTYGSLMQDNPEKFNFEADPGYQFRKDLGERDLNTRLATMGLTNSGAALKQGMDYNQGLGAQEYQNAWQRYLDRNNNYNQNRNYKTGTLMNFAQTGQNAANQMSNNENMYGSNLQQATSQQGQAQQSSIIGAGNAKAAGYAGAANAIGNGISMYAGGIGGGSTYKNTGAA